ncbi:DUF917 family protein [Streptomyces sp. NBC_01618]|uniref:S-methyl thiohydantoin desulfurase domain-containing protein n=1 Tax=Streptomyces sp. NBC_01618 TaxID=2975900 RepID=UPI003867927F|nr:DUF917 family protein [Streptomyces sp. NBC_01618]
MRELNADDARRGVLGGGVFACGGGGWRRHGELMGHLATSVGRPILATVDELPADAWVATVTAIGAPAAKNWEIRPVDYVHALQKLIDVCEHPIAAVMTAQNGYSTTHNGWMQSAVLGVPVLDAAGDIRAHPTGKLGSMSLTSRLGYVSTQVVSGGNRELHGHFLSVNQGSVQTCDDVLRDISVRTGGFIASARNPVELSWVKQHAALGAISLALDLGHAMESAAEKASNGARGEAVVQAVCDTIGAREVSRGPLHHEVELVTKGGWDHGTFRIGDCTVPYLNEYMAVERDGERVASYPDTIVVLRAEDGFPVAVEEARAGMDVVLLVADSTTLPLSTSAVDPVAVGECEELMGMEFLRHLPTERGVAA